MPSMCQIALCSALYHIYYLSLLKPLEKLNIPKLQASCKCQNKDSNFSLNPKPMFFSHYVMLSSYM